MKHKIGCTSVCPPLITSGTPTEGFRQTCRIYQSPTHWGYCHWRPPLQGCESPPLQLGLHHQLTDEWPLHHRIQGLQFTATLSHLPWEGAQAYPVS